MAEKITPRVQDFPQWYQDVVLQSKLADYSPVKGCMVIRPNGYAIWENIQRDLNERIKDSGAKNCYFPLFIPESFLKKEAEHVEGFAPECAVVTHAGGKELEEKLVVRPTSETIINSMFSKWIQSYRDLPLMVNQWANVVRWEMRTRLFLRTTEFLWQEGHTCHATLDEAEQEARTMLKVYRDFAEEVLAVPAYIGLKSDNEKFAGALRTYTFEAMMQDKKALQAGTSHNLTDNFAKAFDTKFLDQTGKLQFVHQTSWGVSTRLIGGVVMTHSDDKGLVLPPRLAHTHVVFVPIMAKAEFKSRLLAKCDELKQAITQSEHTKNLPYKPIVFIDADDSKQSGWKFHEYELTGVPLRVDLGPRDLEAGKVVIARRDTGEKEIVSFEDFPRRVTELLTAIQSGLLEKAKKFRDENTFDFDAGNETYEDFKKALDEKGGFFILPWANDRTQELKVKEETKATLRCILLDDQFTPVKAKRNCIVTGKSGAVRAVFARNY